MISRLTQDPTGRCTLQRRIQVQQLVTRIPRTRGTHHFLPRTKPSRRRGIQAATRFPARTAADVGLAAVQRSRQIHRTSPLIPRGSDLTPGHREAAMNRYRERQFLERKRRSKQQRTSQHAENFVVFSNFRSCARTVSVTSSNDQSASRFLETSPVSGSGRQQTVATICTLPQLM